MKQPTASYIRHEQAFTEQRGLFPRQRSRKEFPRGENLPFVASDQSVQITTPVNNRKKSIKDATTTDRSHLWYQTPQMRNEEPDSSLFTEAVDEYMQQQPTTPATFRRPAPITGNGQHV
jgi:hypothetical protein